jgi:membrane-bound lytic murein transglycosylase B
MNRVWLTAPRMRHDHFVWLARSVAGFIAALLAVHIFAVAISGGANAKPRKAAASSQTFQIFVASLWPDAQARGISRSTFDAAFEGVSFDPKIVAHTKNQAEFVKPIWVYLAAAVSAGRIERGQEKADAQRQWLNKAKSTYGVEPSVIMGIWGLETDFGGFAGSDNVIKALASLAFVHYRGDYFRDELLSALAILQEGDISPREMRGSWAGAMGQTQFMPSSFNEYAVDFDGGGRRDIWNNAADAIGSTANYLAKHGWIAGEPWGMEVQLPEGFELSEADSSRLAPFKSFSARGVTRSDGRALPGSGEAQLLMPAGLKGPVFLVTANFKAIKSYNNSTSYALGVALLGDRIMGGRGLAASWPREAPLNPAQMRLVQSRLQKMGYDVGKIDGQIGESVRAAVRAYQQKVGLVPDGYPTLGLLAQLKH